MKKLDPAEGSRLAVEWLEEEMQKQLSLETDMGRKRLFTAFYGRQKKCMEALRLVRAEKPEEKPALTLAEQEKWLEILLHPAGNLVLPVIIMVLALFRLNIPTAIVCVLMLVRSVLLLLVKQDKKKDRTEQKPMTPYVDDDDLTQFLRSLRADVAIDVNSVMSQFATVNVKEQKNTVGDMITVFAALYEAKVDDPQNDDLSYPLSVLKSSLHRVGLEVVSYSPENAALFDVEEVNYPSQERTPAIRNREDGIIVKKGYYLKEKE